MVAIHYVLFEDKISIIRQSLTFYDVVFPFKLSYVPFIDISSTLYWLKNHILLCILLYCV